jgi:hypothetical protein
VVTDTEADADTDAVQAKDASAGFTVFILLIPQGLADALLAGDRQSTPVQLLLCINRKYNYTHSY